MPSAASGASIRNPEVPIITMKQLAHHVNIKSFENPTRWAAILSLEKGNKNQQPDRNLTNC